MGIRKVEKRSSNPAQTNDRLSVTPCIVQSDAPFTNASIVSRPERREGVQLVPVQKFAVRASFFHSPQASQVIIILIVGNQLARQHVVLPALGALRIRRHGQVSVVDQLE